MSILFNQIWYNYHQHETTTPNHLQQLNGPFLINHAPHKKPSSHCPIQKLSIKAYMQRRENLSSSTLVKHEVIILLLITVDQAVPTNKPVNKQG